MAALVKSKEGDPDQLPLDIFPLTKAKVSVSSWIVVFFINGVTQINRLVDNVMPDVLIIFVTTWISCYCLMAVLRAYARDRQALENQIEAFSIREAQCSWTRDRETVENTVLQWFDDVETCNQHIRQKVRKQVLLALGPESHYSTKLLLPMVLLFGFNEIDYIVGGYYAINAHAKIMAFFSMSAVVLSLVPSAYRLPLA